MKFSIVCLVATFFSYSIFPTDQVQKEVSSQYETLLDDFLETTQEFLGDCDEGLKKVFQRLFRKKFMRGFLIDELYLNLSSWEEKEWRRHSLRTWLGDKLSIATARNALLFGAESQEVSELKELRKEIGIETSAERIHRKFEPSTDGRGLGKAERAAESFFMHIMPKVRSEIEHRKKEISCGRAGPCYGISFLLGEDDFKVLKKVGVPLRVEKHIAGYTVYKDYFPTDSVFTYSFYRYLAQLFRAEGLSFKKFGVKLRPTKEKPWFRLPLHNLVSYPSEEDQSLWCNAKAKS